MRYSLRLLSFFLLLIPLLSIGQNVEIPKANGLDLFTQRALQPGGYLHGLKDISLFVNGDQEQVQRAVEEVGGTYKYTYSRINAVTVPQRKLDAFMKAIEGMQVQNGDLPMVPLMDTSKIVNRINDVHQGTSPLPQAYKGDGVIVGIIDEGFDIDHPDFLDANGKTRVQFLWDHFDNAGDKPQPYNYGTEWTKQDIDLGLCTHVAPLSANSHGTNVTGAACANDRNTGKYTGVAPNADMIIVAFDLQGGSFLSNFVDAVDYIFKKADAMGKPCVINASMGTYYGSRDARDFASIIIEELLEERCGRSLVCAFGNEGDQPYHLGYEVSPGDTFFTWFRVLPAPNNDVYLWAWADTADFNDLNFSLGGDEFSGNTWVKYVGGTDFINIKDYGLTAANPSKLIIYDIFNPNFVATCSTLAQLDVAAGTYSFEAIIIPNNLSTRWRFTTAGEGKFDIWSSRTIMGTSDMVLTPPSASLFPDSAKYKKPNTDMTQVSSFTNSDKVISVANYENRTYFIDVNGDTAWLPHQSANRWVIPGEISYSSAWGPTRDGRQKPDIGASGSTTLCSGNSNHIALLMGTNQFEKVADDTMHNRNGGTSLASPIVAGVVALYLQRFPDACYDEIKEAVIQNAYTDNFTGSTPNYRWGYGKVDGFATLQTEVVMGCTDPTAYNYNPNATNEDGSCIAKVNGCTDPDALNYDATANVDDGSCIEKIIGCTDTAALTYNPAANVHDQGACQYATGINSPDSFISLGFYPNPFDGKTTLVYQLKPGMEGNTTLVVHNLLGQEVDRLVLKRKAGNMAYEIPDKHQGVYIYRVIFEGNIVASDKLVVY